MPITIDGSGTVTGISVGGLPDGIVDTDMIAADAVTAPKRGAGAIIQVVQAVKTDVSSWSFETSNANFKETGLQAIITPTKASNIILIWASGMYGGTVAEENTYWTISRSSDGNYFQVGDTSGSRTRVTTGSYINSTSRPETFSCFAIDTTHNTTSANTYKLLSNGNNSSGTGYLNRTGDNSDGFFRPRGTSTLILQEIEV
tara:strand:+ start:157 stop:759 length:603 start_codon:yes stop_codon:yes gene_type:complete